MKIWVYNKMLQTLLKTNRFNSLYLKIWRLWHIEKRKTFKVN